MKWIELDPARRPWRYNGLGQKVWKDRDYLKLWTDSDQKRYDAEKDYEIWREKYGYEWEVVTAE